MWIIELEKGPEDTGRSGEEWLTLAEMWWDEITTMTQKNEQALDRRRDDKLL